MRHVRDFLDTDEGCKIRSHLLPASPSAELAKKLPLRLVDVDRCRIGATLSSAAEPHAGDGGGDALPIWAGRGRNFLSAPLRVEPDDLGAEMDLCSKAEGRADAQETDQSSALPTELVEVFHSEHSSTAAFGHPCILRLRDGDDPSALIQAKLQVPDAEFAKWHVRQLVGTVRTTLEPGGWRCGSSSSSQPCLVIERRLPFHRARSPPDARRVMKPLTIRGAGK